MTMVPKSKSSHPLHRKMPDQISVNPNPSNFNVRLIERPPRPPATAVEQLALETLKHEGRTSFTKLVDHVTREVYLNEVRRGTWVLDIALFGLGLFAPDVVFELNAGDDILWDIERQG
jgi:hypothetical protein